MLYVSRVSGHEEGPIYHGFPSFGSWYAGDFDPSGFDAYEELLREAKTKATPEALDAAVTAAARYAAVDTNAIEGIYTVDRGFTRTVATQLASWEAVMDSRGAHVRAAFEDALEAYGRVLDASTRTVEISELWIKELHQIVCASQDHYTVYTDAGPQRRPLPKGTYKTMPNSPMRNDETIHAYAPPSDTPAEMYRLVQELRSEAFLTSHPIVQAAYAHYSYVAIHPFADGNGRVARALASVYLYRSPGIPLVVFADQRNEYFDALELADTGNSGPFIEFMAVRTIDAIGIVRSMLQSAAPPVSQTMKGINQLFGSATQDSDLVAAVVRLRTMAVAELKRQISDISIPPQLNFRANSGRVGSAAHPDDYGGIGDDACFYMIAESRWPHRVRQITAMEIFVATESGLSSEFMIASSRPGDGLEVWLREVDPSASETLKLKLSAWLEGKIAEILADVEGEASSGAGS